MKNIKFSIIIPIAIIAMALINGCNSKSEVYPVTISFENPAGVDSVYENDTYVLSGQVTSEGPIQKVQFFRSFTFNGGEDEVEMAATEITDVADGNCSFSVNIPGVTSLTKVNVVVTQSGGHQDAASFTIKAMAMNIISYPNRNLGGWNSNYGSCLDAETGNVYGGSKTKNPDIAPLLDVYYEDSKLGSTDLDSMYYNNVNRLRDTGTRYNKTTFTPTDFDNIKSDVFFKNYTAPLREVTIEPGDVVYFITKGGKKGLLKIISLTDPKGDLLLDEKIQK